ncbi:vitrin-like [Oculina patagonica]
MAVLLDASRSINKQQFKQLKQFALALARNIDLSGAARLGLITFNSEARLRLAFDESNKQNLEYVEKTLDKEKRDRKWNTRIDLALKKANNMLFTQTGNEDNKAKVLVLLTDGKSHPQVNEYGSFVGPLKKKDVDIFAVGIGPDVRKDELLNIVSGRKERLFMVHDFHSLSTILADVLRDACEGSSGSGLDSDF